MPERQKPGGINAMLRPRLPGGVIVAFAPVELSIEMRIKSASKVWILLKVLDKSSDPLCEVGIAGHLLGKVATRF